MTDTIEDFISNHTLKKSLEEMFKAEYPDDKFFIIQPLSGGRQILINYGYLKEFLSQLHKDAQELQKGYINQIVKELN